MADQERSEFRGEISQSFGKGKVQVFVGDGGKRIRTEIQMTEGKAVTNSEMNWGVTRPRTLEVFDLDDTLVTSVKFMLDPDAIGSTDGDMVLVDKDGNKIGCWFTGNNVHLAIARRLCPGVWDEIDPRSSRADGVAEWVKAQFSKTVD